MLLLVLLALPWLARPFEVLPNDVIALASTGSVTGDWVGVRALVAEAGGAIAAGAAIDDDDVDRRGLQSSLLMFGDALERIGLRLLL